MLASTGCGRRPKASDIRVHTEAINSSLLRAFSGIDRSVLACWNQVTPVGRTEGTEAEATDSAGVIELMAHSAGDQRRRESN